MTIECMKLDFETESKAQRKRARKKMIKPLKAKWAVYHMIRGSDNATDICHAVHLSRNNLEKLINSPAWEEALDFWFVEGLERFRVPVENEKESEQLRKQKLSLKVAEKHWREMIQNGDDLFPRDDMLLAGRSEDSNPPYQVGIEALSPPVTPRRFSFWIHDITTAIWAMGLLI